MAPSVKSINQIAVASLSNVSPVTVSIAPLVVDAEGELQIEGSGFDAGATVRAAGIPVVGKTNGQLRSKSVSATKLCVYVPSMEEIQKTKATFYGVTYSYSRNAVLMPLALTVCNSDGSSFGPIALLLRLPAPALGMCRTEGATVLIGEPAGNDQGTDHLGGKAPAPDADGGELRWYSKDQLDTLSAIKVDVLPQWKDAGDFWNLLVSAAANPASFVTSSVWTTLVNTRHVGQLVDSEWHDDGVTFEVPLTSDPLDPIGCGYGIAVAWRDDVPSRPLLVDVTPHATTINEIPVLGLEGVLSGVPLAVSPGDILRIAGANIDTTTKVRAIGVAVGGAVGGSLRVHDGGPGELRVYVPSMAELETTNATVTATQLISLSYAYQRNTVLIPFGLELVNPDGASSGPIMMVATLPSPTIGTIHLDNEIVTIGSIAGESGTRDLGNPCPASENDGLGSQIRWYSLDQLSLIPSVTLQAPKLTAGGLWNFLLGLAANPSTAFFNMRDGGTRPQDHVLLTDDGLTFQLPGIPGLPDFGTGGILVVWRDDIPSLPRVIWDFGFDCSNPTQVQFVRDKIQQAAAELWRRIPTVELTEPLDPGQVVSLVMERAVTAADNFLAKLLDTPDSGFGIQFRYEINAVAICEDESGNDATSYLESLVPKVVSQAATATLAVEPEMVSQTSSGNKSNTVGVQLYIWIQLPLVGCNDLLKDIPVFPQFFVTQKTIPIPTVAVFFIDADYAGPPLFALPSGQSLPGLPSGMRWDHNGVWMSDGNPAPSPLLTLNAARDKVVEALSIAKGFVDAAKAAGFFTSASWLPTLEKLSDIVDNVLSGAQFVVDTTGEMWSLWRVVWGHDWFWGDTRFTDSISSVLLIGQQAKSSGIYYHCFWDVSYNNIELVISQPDDHYITGLSDLSCLALAGTVAGYALDVPDVRNDANHGDWHDALTSIKIVEQ